MRVFRLDPSIIIITLTGILAQSLVKKYRYFHSGSMQTHEVNHVAKNVRRHKKYSNIKPFPVLLLQTSFPFHLIGVVQQSLIRERSVDISSYIQSQSYEKSSYSATFRVQANTLRENAWTEKREGGT